MALTDGLGTRRKFCPLSFFRCSGEPKPLPTHVGDRPNRSPRHRGDRETPHKSLARCTENILIIARSHVSQIASHADSLPTAIATAYFKIPPSNGKGTILAADDDQSPGAIRDNHFKSPPNPTRSAGSPTWRAVLACRQRLPLA